MNGDGRLKGSTQKVPDMVHTASLRRRVLDAGVVAPPREPSLRCPPVKRVEGPLVEDLSVSD